MWKNVLYFMVGGLVFSVLIARPTIALEPDFSNMSIAMSGRELAIFDHKDGMIHYYNKADGTFLRTHQITQLGARMKTTGVR